MFILRGALSVSLALVLTTAVFAAANQPLNSRLSRASTHRGIEGTVVSVHHNPSMLHEGWIKIRRFHHHNSGRRGGTSASASLGSRSRNRGNVQTVHVKRSTSFQRLVMGANGQSSNRLTSFAALRRGERVRIVSSSNGQHAARVVHILSNGSNSGSRYSYGSSYGRRYGHRRHSLVGYGSRGRFGGRRYYSNRNYSNRTRVKYVTIVRPIVRHSLISGRVARRPHHRNQANRRHTVAHHAGTKKVKSTSTAHKTTKPKHTTAKPKHTTAKPKHATAKPRTHKSSVSHARHKPAASHRSKPHSTSHRKR